VREGGGREAGGGPGVEAEEGNEDEEEEEEAAAGGCPGGNDDVDPEDVGGYNLDNDEEEGGGEGRGPGGARDICPLRGADIDPLPLPPPPLPLPPLPCSRPLPPSLPFSPALPIASRLHPGCEILTKAPIRLACSSRALQCLFCCNVSALPTTNTFNLPRVRPTFIRRTSAKNPIPFFPPALTHENRIMSFSFPWYPSTVFNSTSSKYPGPSALANWLFNSSNWAWYGVITPTFPFTSLPPSLFRV